MGRASKHPAAIPPLPSASTANSSPSQPTSTCPTTPTPTSRQDLGTGSPIQAQAVDASSPNSSNPTDWIEENPEPCLRCLSYMLSYPAKAQHEVDEKFGPGIVCARIKSDKKKSGRKRSKTKTLCLRCAPGKDPEQCQTIPTEAVGLVKTFVQLHKAYVADPGSYNPEMDLRDFTKIQLLSTRILHLRLKSIGHFADLESLDPDIEPEPLRTGEAEKLVREIESMTGHPHNDWNSGAAFPAISAAGGGDSGQRNAMPIMAPVQKTNAGVVQLPPGYGFVSNRPSAPQSYYQYAPPAPQGPLPSRDETGQTMAQALAQASPATASTTLAYSNQPVLATPPNSQQLFIPFANPSTSSGGPSFTYGGPNGGPTTSGYLGVQHQSILNLGLPSNQGTPSQNPQMSSSRLRQGDSAEGQKTQSGRDRDTNVAH